MTSTNFEWDEDKRLKNIEKHRIDFLDAAEIFAADYLRLSGRSDAEQRSIAVGKINGVAIAVVFTLREDAIRIISARRARKNEREHYETHVAGRDSPS